MKKIPICKECGASMKDRPPPKKGIWKVCLACKDKIEEKRMVKRRAVATAWRENNRKRYNEGAVRHNLRMKMKRYRLETDLRRCLELLKMIANMDVPYASAIYDEVKQVREFMTDRGWTMPSKKEVDWVTQLNQQKGKEEWKHKQRGAIPVAKINRSEERVVHKVVFEGKRKN